MPDSSTQGSIHSTFHPFRRSAQKGTRMQFFTHIRTHDSIFFCEAKKNNIIWRRRRKKIGVRCKNLAFYITESLNKPFFAEQKRKNGAAGKKNLGTACMVRDFMVRSATQFPKKCKKLFFQICKSFFFFFKTEVQPQFYYGI